MPEVIWYQQEMRYSAALQRGDAPVMFLIAGTGAAHEVSLDHTGHPIVSKLRDCYLAAVTQGRQGQIPLWAAGGLGKTGDLAADAFKMIALGANGVLTGKLILQMAGCVGSDLGRCRV